MKNNNLNYINSESTLIGKVYIQSTDNNTIITLTDLKGNTLAWSSSGTTGISKGKRSTTIAAVDAGELIAKKIIQKNIKIIQIILKGLGRGRENIIRTLRKNGLLILSIYDQTHFPHGGCRLPKKRRL
jgi:small subunit ribosomal protein S11